MLSLTLLLCAGFGLFVSKRIFGDYFSPPAVYNFFWAFALGVLELGWIAYDPLGYQVWQVILVSWAGFMGGCMIISLYAFSRPRWLEGNPSFRYLDPKRFEKALFVMFGLGVFGFLVQLAHLHMQIGLGTFLSDPQRARELHTNVKYLGFFNLLNVANFVLAVAYLVLYRKPHKWVVLLMVWALVTTFVTTDRTRFFYLIIWSFYMGVYLFRTVNLTPKMIIATLSTLLVLLGFFILVARMYKKEAFEDNMEFVKVSEEFAPLVDPYIYLTGSFPVLQAFMEDNQEPTMGRATFGPFVKILELISPDIERIELTGKFYRVPIELNACTWLEPFYKDFGIAGTLIGPFLAGLLCMTVYVAMRRRKTLFSAYFMGLLSFCITISIFVNHLTQVGTWFFVLAGYLIYRYSYTSHEQDPALFRENIL